MIDYYICMNSDKHTFMIYIYTYHLSIIRSILPHSSFKKYSDAAWQKSPGGKVCRRTLRSTLLLSAGAGGRPAPGRPWPKMMSM